MEDRPAGRAAGYGAVLLTIGGLAAAFGVASCCALPMLLAGLGASVASLGTIGILAEPHRGLLLVGSALFLAGGGVLVWRQRASVCSPTSICARPGVRAMTVAGLLLGAALLYLGLAYA
jgi:mercuric ion transport protein